MIIKSFSIEIFYYISENQRKLLKKYQICDYYKRESN